MGGGGGAKSYYREKACTYINYSIISCKLSNCLVKERLNTKYKYLYIMEITTRSPFRDVVLEHFKHESAVNLGEGERGG
jgi:hypothetical protein